MNPEERESIRRNIEDVRRRIAEAAASAGRSGDITLIAVTKTIPHERIIEAIDAGITDLGENRVQELTDKIGAVDREVNWHMIGHLQKNKVKYIIEKVKLIHSVDSEELCDEIQKRAERAGRIVDVLVQVNVSGEESKFGIPPERTEEFLRRVSEKSNIRVRGLMTIAPLVDDPEKTRPYFRKMYEIFIDIKRKTINNISMDYLSMGMSNDFEVAIQEGSNMVRIGTAIFGKRK